MPFTEAPKYDKDRETWVDFVGETVIVEPIRKMDKVPTKYGPQDAFESIVWVLKENELEPHGGIRIFSQRIVSQLEVAFRTGSPIAGFIEREGNGVRLNNCTPEMAHYLEQLWDYQNGVITPEAEVNSNGSDVTVMSEPEPDEYVEPEPAA